MRKRRIVTLAIACCFAFLQPQGYGQTQDGAEPTPAQAGTASSQEKQQPLPRLGIALTAGTLGVGVQAATAIAPRTNVRGGFNYFSLGVSGTESTSNLTYDATLRLESFEVLVDQYLKGPFHVGGGALLYDGFRGTADVHVAGGQNITLNHVGYFSSNADPVIGVASVGARKIAPELLIGFGNLLPRSSRHFSMNFDLGVVFQGSPSAKLSLMGSTCAGQNTGCSPIGSNPVVQANIAGQQTIINSDLKPFQFYPVIRLSFGYKF